MQRFQFNGIRARTLASGWLLAALLLSGCQAAQPTQETASAAYPTAILAPPVSASAEVPTTAPTVPVPTQAPTLAPVAAAPAVAPAATAVEKPAQAAGPSISVVNDPKYGPILVGDGGMALYIFTNDAPDTSNCSGGCLEKWPPLTAMGTPVLGSGVDQSLIGKAALPDGSQIVTYNHMPLYYWVGDSKPGDTTGEGVGDVWFLISPDGSQVKAPMAAVLPTKPAKNDGGKGGYNY